MVSPRHLERVYNDNPELFIKVARPGSPELYDFMDVISDNSEALFGISPAPKAMVKNYGCYDSMP